MTAEARPIKILFLAANPVDTSPLRLDEESRAIDQALRAARYRDRFEIEQHWAVRVGDLPELLLRYEPDVVHFSGHGSPKGEIVLEASRGSGNTRDGDREIGMGGFSEPGRPGYASARAISETFRILKDNIRCVVLNACYSEVQAQAIAEHIDCVVGMSKAVGDRSAIDFAASFYLGLGYGRSVQEAFELGCNRIDLEGFGEQDTPKLLALRSKPAEMYLLWLIKLSGLHRQVSVRDIAFLRVGQNYVLPPDEIDQRSLEFAPVGVQWEKASWDEADKRAERLTELGLMELRWSERTTSDLGRALVAFDDQKTAQRSRQS